jgi:hypothetical protein
MIVLLFALVGIILLFLAGFNVGRPRFSLGWLGLACLAVAHFAPVLSAHR